MSGWLEQQTQWETIYTFNSWATRFLGYDYQREGENGYLPKMIKKANSKFDYTGRYEAILVDEAQDFYDEWFQILLEAIDPDTNSLFFVYDNTQSVYGKGHRATRDFRWRDLGLDIQGRNSQVLDLNYRNSPEILEIAWQYIKPALDQANLEVGRRTYDQRGRVTNTPAIWEIVEPLKNPSRSSRIQPMLVDVSSREIPSTVAEEVKLALNNYPESSIGILTHPKNKDIRKEIDQKLTELNIEHNAPKRSQDRYTNVVQRPCVLVDSWNAVKGVEFDAVIIVGVDWVKDHADLNKDFEEKAGLYVAMTRARDHLVMLYEEKTPTVELIEKILESEPILRDA